MLRTILLLLGGLLLFLKYIIPYDINAQFLLFLVGILILGVPHGAADLLVATRNATIKKVAFSTSKFLIIYLSRMLLFGVTLWLLPVFGIILFILFAAYHFGETDLYDFKTNTILGKLFVISYGVLILFVILLNHFEESKPLFLLFDAGKENIGMITWIGNNRYLLMSISGIFFFTSTFIYLLKYKSFINNEINAGKFLINMSIILIILFNLPMLLGFTFYFVVWHSVLSMNNIVSYLRSNGMYSINTIAKQIMLYSSIAIIGIGLFGAIGFMFINKNTVEVYVFLGLAVLTAPHMQIMNDMYQNIRSKNGG